MATFVLLELLACARTSAKCADWSACRPKAVIASVTMSDTVPSSSPEAAARYMMPGRPETISCVFQPAIAMYSNPCPASVAENFVVRPISAATSFSCFISPEDAWEIACTVLI